MNHHHAPQLCITDVVGMSFGDLSLRGSIQAHPIPG